MGGRGCRLKLVQGRSVVSRSPEKLPLEDMKEVKKLAMRTFAERNFQAEVPRP